MSGNFLDVAAAGTAVTGELANFSDLTLLALYAILVMLAVRIAFGVLRKGSRI